MKKIYILTLFIFITSFIFGQVYKPSYQSNYSLDFDSFLSGVKYAYITLDDDDVKYIVDNPRSGNAFAISGLISYLKTIGFETVNWGTRANTPQDLPSICELVIVSASWGYEKSTFTDIELNFYSCKGDVFTFKSSKNITFNENTNLSISFHNTFIKMYGYNKDKYSSYNRLTLNSEMTEWTEDNLKTHLKLKGADPIEGIYESSIGTPLTPKYKLGLLKNANGYNLIYFSGATNYLDWKSGEIKAKLYSTATASLFKADWYMGNKEINRDPYVTFKRGLMNLVMQGRDETLFIKLFPTASDNVTTTNVGPASGTGFAVTSSGMVVTNYHVVNGATTIKVRGINGDFTKLYNAKVLIEDKNNDLAIIKIDNIDFTTLGTIPFVINAKSSDVGTSVFVMGYPLRASMGDEIKLTNGIISSKSGFQGDVTSYQISAPIQPGNSGGPLFDSEGNLIGIVNAKLTGAENASYAIKASYLINLFDLLPTTPKLQTISGVSGKTLTEQVKTLKKFTYIIEVN
jgi:S1-C subfamily serine protease